MNELDVARPALPTDEYIARLRLDLAAPVDLARVPEAFGSQEARWLGELAPDQEPAVRRILCDLELRAGGSERALFRKAALVALGEPRRDGGGWVVPLEWRATTMAPLFPVFVGRLRIGPDKIELDGGYAPPGGKLGYLIDAALLGVAARETGRWFLRKVALVLA